MVRLGLGLGCRDRARRTGLGVDDKASLFEDLFELLLVPLVTLFQVIDQIVEQLRGRRATGRESEG